MLLGEEGEEERAEVSWEEEELELTSNLAAGGRGMELSELSRFGERLVAPDYNTENISIKNTKNISGWWLQTTRPGWCSVSWGRRGWPCPGSSSAAARGTEPADTRQAGPLSLVEH